MINLFKHLLPRALAWSITKPTKYLRKFFDGLVEGLLVPARLFIDLFWYDMFPQTTRKLADWEWQFGIQKAQLTEQQRRDRLDARWGHFSINLSPRAVQDALQANGFPVYVHDWWVPGTDPPVPRDPLAAPGGYYLPNRLFTIEPNLLALCGETGVECGEADAVCGQYDRFNINQVEYPVLTGTQLVTNGDFKLWTADNPDGWTVVETPPNSEVTEAVGGGACRIVSDSTFVSLTQMTIFTVGKTYRLELDAQSIVSGAVTLNSGAIGTVTQEGHQVFYFYATLTYLEIKRIGAMDLTFTNVTLYEDTAELLPNGYFNAWTADDPDVWTVTGESVAVREVTQVGNAARMFSDASADLSIDQATVVTVGIEYILLVEVTAAATGAIEVYNGATLITTLTAVGSHSFKFTATATDIKLLIPNAGPATDITVTNMSVKRAYVGTDELLDNWDFTSWTGDNPDGWLVVEWPPTRQVTQSGSAARFITDGGTIILTQFFSIIVDGYYILEVVVSAAASGALLVQHGNDILATLTSVGTYTLRFRGFTGSIGITGNGEAADITLDSVSIKKVDLSRYKTFYVGGQTWPDSAIVPASRREEFEDLVLKLKPAHLWPMFLIDYQ
jgi:hypothetical protein